MTGDFTYMYSRCAEWTAAALLYRHRTMTEDNTSSVASNYRVKTTTTKKDILKSLHHSIHRSVSKVEAFTVDLQQIQKPKHCGA